MTEERDENSSGNSSDMEQSSTTTENSFEQEIDDPWTTLINEAGPGTCAKIRAQYDDILQAMKKDPIHKKITAQPKMIMWTSLIKISLIKLKLWRKVFC